VQKFSRWVLTIAHDYNTIKECVKDPCPADQAGRAIYAKAYKSEFMCIIASFWAKIVEWGIYLKNKKKFFWSLCTIIMTGEWFLC